MRQHVLGLVAALAAAPLLAQQPGPAPLELQQGGSSPAPTAPAEDSKWHFVVAPYFWMSGLSGEVSFKGIPPQSVDASFSEIMDHFDIGYLLHFEAQKKRLGLALDTVFLKLSADVATDQPVLGQLGLTAEMRQRLSDLFGFYRLARGGKESGNPAFADVLVGIRFVGTSAQIEGQNFASTKQTLDWVDAMIGFRGALPLGRRATLDAEADISGFGSKFTYQLEGLLRLHVSKRWSLGAGYRYLDIDYDKGSGTERKLYDVAYKGPLVAIAFAW